MQDNIIQLTFDSVKPLNLQLNFNIPLPYPLLFVTERKRFVPIMLMLFSFLKESVVFSCYYKDYVFAMLVLSEALCLVAPRSNLFIHSKAIVTALTSFNSSFHSFTMKNK